MKTKYAPSLGLPSGLPVRIFETIEEFDTAAGVKGKALEYANSYGTQKGSLVDGRDWLHGLLTTGHASSEADELAVVGQKDDKGNAVAAAKSIKVSYKVTDATLAGQNGLFGPDPKKNKTVQVKDKDGKVTGTKVENTETEGEYIKRFRSAVLSGGIVIKGVAADKDAELAWEQSLVDQFGFFSFDPKKAERTGKAKTPPQYAMNGATAIIEKGGAESVKKWIRTFTKEGIPFQPFDTDDAVKNKLNLAWAIKAREDKKAETEYQ